MIANGLHWFVTATIAKFKICRFNAKAAQISLCSLQSFKVTEGKSELVLNIVNLRLLSVPAFVFAGIIIFCEQAIASDHSCKVALFVCFGCCRRWVCAP